MQVPNGPIRAAAFACLVFAGCDRPLPTAPSPITDSSPPAPTPRPPTITVHEIAVGETIEGRYTYCFPIGTTWCTGADDELHYVFTAPRDGTVVVSLTWE